MERPQDPAAYLKRRDELETLPLRALVHQHNAKAIRHTVCLTDPLGFTDMGVHLVRLRPGDLSSEHHFHEEDEEFIYILSGPAVAFIGDQELDVGAGDFMAFPKGSPPHHMENRGSDDVVYLVGGTRSPIDICNYPRLGLRQYRVHGRREFVRVADVKHVNR
jgi:uncharacterized cupin superfamily protein